MRYHQLPNTTSKSKKVARVRPARKARQPQRKQRNRSRTSSKTRGRQKPNRIAQPEQAGIMSCLKAGLAPGTFSSVGAAAGSAFGPVGTLVGRSAGDLISQITGFGDYVVKRNSIVAGSVASTTVPTFSGDAQGLRVKHREFIQDITGSTNFSTAIFQDVNPTNQYIFPWLSQIATSFEEYELHGLVFEFRSTSEFSTTNPALGTVVMCGIYDVTKPEFTTKQQMEQYEFSVSIKPNMDGMVPFECARSQEITANLLVGPGSGPAQLYQLANLQVATQGQPSAYVVGELWVTYDISFKKPRPSSALPSNPFLTLSTYPKGSGTAANPQGTSGWAALGNLAVGAGASVYGTAVNFVIFNPGCYLFLVFVKGTGLTNRPYIIGAVDSSAGANELDWSNGANNTPGLCSADGTQNISATLLVLDESNTKMTMTWSSGVPSSVVMWAIPLSSTGISLFNQWTGQYIPPGY